MRLTGGLMSPSNSKTAQPVPFVSLGRLHSAIISQMTATLVEGISASDFILGDSVANFERQFSNYLGGGLDVIGVGNGTDAIEIALRSLQLPQKSEVLVPSNSFIASATGVLRAGLIPRFVEPDPTSLLVGGQEFEKAVTRKTSAILMVHLFGNVSDISGVLEVARNRKIAVVEDVAQAHGALWRGSHVGTLGDVAATSFYPGKNLGALGDGGAVITKSPEIAERARLLRNYGSIKKYEHEMFGFNSRLDALQARLLSVKLPHLDAWNDDRRQIASVYYSFFRKHPMFQVPPPAPETQPVHHLFPITLEKRDELGLHLRRHGIEFGIHYPTPIPFLPPFAKMKSTRGKFRVSKRIADSIISLPMFPGLREEEQIRVLKALESFENSAF